MSRPLGLRVEVVFPSSGTLAWLSPPGHWKGLQQTLPAGRAHLPSVKETWKPRPERPVPTPSTSHPPSVSRPPSSARAPLLNYISGSTF